MMRMIFPMRKGITEMKWNEHQGDDDMDEEEEEDDDQNQDENEDNTQVGDASMCAADQGDLCTGQHHAITTIFLPLRMSNMIMDIKSASLYLSPFYNRSSLS